MFIHMHTFPSRPKHYIIMHNVFREKSCKCVVTAKYDVFLAWLCRMEVGVFYLSGLGPFPRPFHYWYVLCLFSMWWTDGRGTESKSYLPPADALPEKVPGLCMTSAAPSAAWWGLSVGQSHLFFLFFPSPNNSSAFFPHTHTTQHSTAQKKMSQVQPHHSNIYNFLDLLTQIVCKCVHVCLYIFSFLWLTSLISPVFPLPGAGDVGLMKGQQEHSHGQPYNVCSVGQQCFLRPGSVVLRVTHAAQEGNSSIQSVWLCWDFTVTAFLHLSPTSFLFLFYYLA